MPKDASQKAPTFAEQASKFQGFTTVDGVQVDPKTQDKTDAGGKNITAGELKAGVKLASGVDSRTNKDTTTKTAAAKVETKTEDTAVELTADEEEAAIEAAQTAAGDEDLTEDEKDAAVAAALEEKKSAAEADDDSKTITLGEAKKLASKRVQEALKRARKAEKRNNDLGRRIAALEAGGRVTLTPAAKAAKTETATLKAPDPKDFAEGKFDDGYIEALAVYHADKRIAEREASSTERQNSEAGAREHAKFVAAKEAFEEAGADLFDDFQEVVMDDVYDKEANPYGWVLSNTLGKLLLTSEVGPQIARYLQANKKVAREIYGLDDHIQAARFGRLEAKFTAEKAAGSKAKTEGDDNTQQGKSKQAAGDTERKVSRAPAPIQRNRGGGGTKQVSADTTDFRAFEAMAMKSG